MLEDREALLKSKVQLELSVADLEESQLSEQDYKVCIICYSMLEYV